MANGNNNQGGSYQGPSKEQIADAISERDGQHQQEEKHLNKMIDLINSQANSLEDQIEKQTKIFKLNAEILEQSSDKQLFEDKARLARAKELGLEKETLEVQKERFDKTEKVLAKANQLYSGQLRMVEELEALEKQKSGAKGDQLVEIERQIKLLNEIADFKNINLKEESKEIKKRIDISGKLEESAKKEKEEKEEQIEQINIIEKKEEEILGQIKDKFKLEKMQNAILFAREKPMMALLQIGMKILNISTEVGKAYDSQRAKLAELTVGVQKYNDGLQYSISAGQQFGLSAQESMEGANELTNNLVRISQLSQQEVGKYGAMTAAYKKFGVSAGEVMNNAMLVFGDTIKEANLLTMEITDLGRNLGPGMAGKIAKDFIPAMSSLAAHTRTKAIKTFKELAVQSRATGLEISRLVGISEQFDTYTGAAEAVGKLNSMLGGDYLNSVQMLHASESERIDMLKRSLQLSGKTFSSLARYEKKTVAASIGISDLNEATKLLGTGSEVYDLLEKKAAKAGMTMEQFQQATRSTKDITEKFQAILQNFAIFFAPVVTVLHIVLDFLGKIAAMGDGWVGWVISLTLSIPLLMKVMGLFGKMIVFLGGSIKSLGTSFMSMGSSMKASSGSISSGIMTIATSAKAGSIGIGILIALFATIGFALLGVAAVIASFGYVLKQMTSFITNFAKAMTSIPKAAKSVGPAIKMLSDSLDQLKGKKVQIQIMKSIGETFQQIGKSVDNSDKLTKEFMPSVVKITEIIQKVEKEKFVEFKSAMGSITELNKINPQVLKALNIEVFGSPKKIASNDNATIAKKIIKSNSSTSNNNTTTTTTSSNTSSNKTEHTINIVLKGGDLSKILKNLGNDLTKKINKKMARCLTSN